MCEKLLMDLIIG